MSDEFRKETEQGFSSEQNTSASEAAQQPEEAKTYMEQETQQSEGQESVSKIHETANEETAKEKPASGTTYSWVNPKLTGEDRKEDNSASYTGQNHFQNDQQRQGFQNGSQETGDAHKGSGYQPYHINVPQPEESRQNRKKDKKVKKPMSLGKKWGMVIAMGAVFGLVAGGVFTGTSMVGMQLTGAGSSNEVTIPTTVTNATASGTTTNTSGMTVKDVAASAMPSLVAISTTTVEEVQTFFGTASQEVPASGTGVIVGQNDEELLIATNNHVVSGASQLSVTFNDDTTIEGQIKGTDEANDLAVVSVKLSDIPEDTQSQIKIATMGDSDALEVGDQVVAIGNALGTGQSVTSGYVSAVDRDITSTDESTGQETTSEGLIQTDAAINPGNSGGALLNMNGELIGINEAKYASAEVEGMGFAIPIAKAEPILENLMSLTTRYKVDEADASYIGITMQDVESSVSEAYGIPAGVRIVEVVEGSPADEAGIKKGDILTEFDGRTVTNSSGLQDILSYYAEGETVDIVVQRADEGEYKPNTLTITLGSADDMPTQTTEEEQQNSLNPFGN